ncbi:MAG: nuclear transport factor 2 family protein [Chloroflexia bacterium]|nr:nuclear transport factor 2 family protein [Chloroflexia bacterium]
MSEDLARRFIDALWALEKSNDLDSIVDTYADDCQVGNVVSPRRFDGKAGARDFWSTYRGTLGEVHSDFHNIIVAGDHAALEWTTKGTGPGGQPIDYDGVSILEMADGKITRFWAYFDPSKLGHELQR